MAREHALASPHRSPPPCLTRRARSSVVRACAIFFDAAPSCPDPKAVAPKKKQIAGKQTPGISEEVAAGTAFLPGRRQVDMNHAQTEGLVEHSDPGMPAEVPVPADAAGKSSVTLAAHMGVPLAQIADTSNARRKNVFNGNHSTVDTVVFGLDVRPPAPPSHASAPRAHSPLRTTNNFPTSDVRCFHAAPPLMAGG